MNTTTRNLTGLALITFLAVNLAVPSLAQAGRGGHDHDHGHRHHHHHDHHDHHRHSRGYVQIYNQSPAYIQPQYGYYQPAPVYVAPPPPVYIAPAPVYMAPPPRVMMGINTGNVDFMLRY